jgi:glycosyltransferase involved in cell wall biosynthesis
MNIVFISASQVPSSAANSIQVMKVCQAFSQLGHTVRLLVPGPGRAVELPDLAAFYGLSVSFPVEWLPANPRLRRYDFAWAAVHRARALHADVVYAWPLQAAVMAVIRRTPVLLEMHEPPEGRFGPLLFRLFVRWPGKQRLLPITQALANILDERYSIRPRLDQVIAPDGVDLERYIDLPGPAEARHFLGLREAFTVGYTGHLYAGRGMKLLARLAQRFTGVEFLGVGGRPEDVESWRERLALAGVHNVIMTGFVANSNLPLYQAAAELLLMPYERSVTGSSGGNTADFCSPMKMFEYMACERAILASDLPVLREVLSEASAVFCPPNDLEAWALALEKLIASPEQRQVLAHQARQGVTKYTWQERARRSLEGW